MVVLVVLVAVVVVLVVVVFVVAFVICVLGSRTDSTSNLKPYIPFPAMVSVVMLQRLLCSVGILEPSSRSREFKVFRWYRDMAWFTEEVLLSVSSLLFLVYARHDHYRRVWSFGLRV